LTLSAAARLGNNSNPGRESRLATDFDCAVRYLTGPPLLPVLAHGG
jgi:hypothetical protein